MLVKSFKDIRMKDVNEAGGKGASLGEMTNAKIQVPPGYVILSSTFDRFIEETKLNAEIEAALEEVDHEEMHTVEEASEKIQELIKRAEISADIKEVIEKEFKLLGAKYVAVRSSATAEDSKSDAWAGQLDSFLNTTKETLLENVRECWASLFTPRAIFYRFEKGLYKSKISVAVVVQKMVESEISGISFSVHPVTEDPNQLIIEAGLGLGEAIVSGQITPDTYVVEKNELKIVENHVSDQERKLVKIEGGGNEWTLCKGDFQKLTNEQIIELSKLVMLIEDHYNFPVDVEWALEKGKFYILQSRPITTLK